MGKAARRFRAITVSLATAALGCVVAAIILMPTLIISILASSTLLGVPFVLLRNSRKTALIVDLVLFGSLVVSHFPTLSLKTPAGPIDMVVLILIISFHEFSSIYSDAKRYEASFAPSDDGEVDPSNTLRVRAALIQRSISASGILLAAAIISEGYFLTAQGASASLYSIYGVAGGLMAVIAFLFIFLSSTSRKPEK